MLKIEDEKLIEGLLDDFFRVHDNSKIMTFVETGGYTHIMDISSGKNFLPTPIFFQKIREEYLCNLSNESCIEAENLAKTYYEMIFTSAIKNKDNYRNFANDFEKKIQPLGKRIFNYIILMRLYSFDLELKKQNRTLLRILNKIALLLARRFTIDPAKAEIMYSVFTLTGASITSVISFFLAGGSKSLFAAVSSSVIVAVAAIIISVAFHRFNDFEHTDISGKNMLALTYKTLVSQMLQNSFGSRFVVNKKRTEEKTINSHEKILEIA